jgi:hypothetical protein
VTTSQLMRGDVNRLCWMRLVNLRPSDDQQSRRLGARCRGTNGGTSRSYLMLDDLDGFSSNRLKHIRSKLERPMRFGRPSARAAPRPANEPWRTRAVYLVTVLIGP